ncbi:MAG: DNA polymerase IV [Saccharofermentanales bacterium]
MFGMPGIVGEIRTHGPDECNYDKVILHCDLNNFYASVECLYKPELKAKPVAVGGSVEKRHGIILAKNQLAKMYGVRTGEPIWESVRKCPDLVIVPPDMSKYVKYSGMTAEIYARYTDIIEPFGIDECWLDVTGSIFLLGDGPHIADDIRKTIREELGLTVSVGVSWNKIFAKLGSDMKKPDATTVITRDNYKSLVWPLPVDDLLFVGRKTGAKLRRIGVNTIGKLAALDEAYLVSLFGKWGNSLYAFANGLDAGVVDKDWSSIKAKGIGNSTTTPHDVSSYEDAKAVLTGLSESVARRMREHRLKGRTVSLSLRDNDLEYRERQRCLNSHTYVSGDILDAAVSLLRENWDPRKDKPLRSLGVRMSSLEDENVPVQLSLWDSDPNALKKESIDRTMDMIRERFGDDSVIRGLMLRKR